MSLDLTHIDWATQATALFQVLMIDLVLAGDNAVAVGLAAGGLAPKMRRKVILWGLGAAVVMRIGFALIAIRLLGIVGLLLAGGFLLLWVCWKMWRDLREQGRQSDAEACLEDATGADIDSSGDVAHPGLGRREKTFAQAFVQILVADLSMSLDNVLAVAGAAREHPAVLVLGLLTSIALMGIAANWIAKLLHRFRWIGYIGLLIVVYVAVHMVWQGHRQVVIDLERTEQYNAAVPSLADITPAEIARHKAHKD